MRKPKRNESHACSRPSTVESNEFIFTKAGLSVLWKILF